MNKLFVTYIISFLAFINSANSQTNISVEGVIHADTISYGSQLYLDYWIVNKDTVPFSSEIDIRMGVASVGEPIQITVSLVSLNESIAAGDSIPFNSVLSVTPQLFQQSGDNLVVIWPSSAAPILADTSYTSIYIKETTALIPDYDSLQGESSKITDLLGREYPSIHSIPNGTIFLKNGKRFIKTFR
ncbi:hypothetical protein N9V43_00920 [Flavobacteriales bacterium]|jgi:hypothetical protein|nr:hypothetical protein [Flavobacteriales bacterium]